MNFKFKIEYQTEESEDYYNVGLSVILSYDNESEKASSFKKVDSILYDFANYIEKESDGLINCLRCPSEDLDIGTYKTQKISMFDIFSVTSYSYDLKAEFVSDFRKYLKAFKQSI